MGSFRVWYAPNNFLPTIRNHSNSIYEKVILLLIIEKYVKVYYSGDTRYPKKVIEISYSEFKNEMGRKKYFESLKQLKTNQVIEYDSTRGPKAKQQINILTPKLVASLKSKKFKTEDVLDTDKFIWL